MLSKFVPVQKLQIEFLNPARNADKYPKGDIYAPSQLPFDYQFAITMVGQPLALVPGLSLPNTYHNIAPLIDQYLNVQTDLHRGQIFPIGNEPSGSSWTGFQSILNDNAGYLLLFRENNEIVNKSIKTYLHSNKSVKLKKIAGYGKSFQGKRQKKTEHLPFPFPV